MEGECRLEYVVAATENEAVGGLGGSQRPRPQFIVLQHLGVPQCDVVPAGPCTRTRTHPTRFCPKSTRVLPAGEVQILIGGSSSCRRTGGLMYGSQRAEVELGRVYAGPSLVGEAGLPTKRPSGAVHRWSDRRKGR